MEKNEGWIKAGFSTILCAVMAVLLCVAPCGARTVDSEDTLNVGTGYPDEQILGDWLDVHGTLNMWPGAYVEYGIYAYPGSTVNIHRGNLGPYGYLTIIGATIPEEENPVVTIYGTDFHVGSENYQTCNSYLISGATLEGYYDEEQTMPISLYISADAPVFLAPPGGCEPEVIPVEIDIKPGSYPNAINLGSNGVIPVAILSTPDLDATTINPDTVFLAGSGVAVRGKGNKSLANQEDVNGDGLLDLVIKIETENLLPEQFQDGGAFLRIHETSDPESAVLFEGWDEITIVPPQ